MLLEFGAKNFGCFKEWMTVDLSLNGNVPDDISHGFKFATAMCFKGANASGKTNALKALTFIFSFMRHSFAYNSDAKIPVDSFFMNDEPSELFVKFQIENKIYLSEFEVTSSQVISETLTDITEGEQILYKRTGNILEKNAICPDREIHLRSNASVISTMNQYEIPQAEPFAQFFENLLSNVSYSGLRQNFPQEVDVAKWYFNNPEDLLYAEQKIRNFDTGIEHIEIKETINKDGAKEYYPVFYHGTADGSKTLPLVFQSEGTKWLYSTLLYLQYSLRTGSILVLDELDASLHETILSELIRDFCNTETNPNNSQVIFSTHNDDVMELVKKYRVYLFKKENGESYCYRIDELPPKVVRNDRPLVSLYKKGILGGVPRIYERS